MPKIHDMAWRSAHGGEEGFGFCGHNDPVAFRNIQIKPLTPAKP